MSNVDDGRNARDTSHKTSTLLSLLSNHLVLQHTAPNLTARDRLALGATNSDFRHLVRQSPGVFRHLDLSAVKTAQFDLAPIDVGGEVWRNVQVDENVTEDEYVTPLTPGNLLSTTQGNAANLATQLLLWSSTGHIRYATAPRSPELRADPRAGRPVRHG